MSGKSALAGFIQGAAGYLANDIRLRQDYDRDVEKAKLLAQLRLDTDKELAEFQEKLNAGKVDKSLSSEDYNSGKVVFRNDRGEEVGSRALTADEIASHNNALEGDRLSLENTRSMIASRGADDARQDARLALDRAQTNESIAASRANRGADSGNGEGILLAEYKNTVDELTKAGASPSAIANFQTRWYEGVNNHKWNKRAQREFLMKMRNAFTGNNGLLTKASVANSKLDSKITAAGED